MKVRFLLPLCVVLMSVVNSLADTNLVSNPNFSDPKDPMATWRTYFPWESQWYANNGKYVKPVTEDGRTTFAGGMKIFAEAWAADPDPGLQQDKWRVPAAPDHPALVTCYRAQFPDPKGSPSEWITASREFTVPKVAYIKGKQQAPEYLTLKVVVFSAKDGKAFVTNFRVTKLP